MHKSREKGGTGLPGYMRFVCRVLRELEDQAAIVPNNLVAFTLSMEITVGAGVRDQIEWP